MEIDFSEDKERSDRKQHKLEMIPDDPHCPYCGAPFVQQERTLLDNTTMAEGLFALADIVEQFGVYAVGALLLRCRYPRSTGADLGRKLGMSRIQFFRLYSRTFRKAPAVAMLIRGCEKTRGLAGGRKPRGAK